MKKIKIIPILILAFVCAFTGIVSAEDNLIYNNIVAEDTKTVTARLSTLGFKDVEYECEYSDSFFSLPEDQYNHQFSKLSMGLASAAGRDVERKNTQDDNLISFYKQMGFSNIETSTYRTEPTTDSIAYGIATKEIDGYTVLAVGVCGHRYSKEWSGNLLVGDGVRHEGFNNAAMQVEEGVKNYIEKNNITGPKKIWITGFSRAAATSNIAAADFTTSGEYQTVYAYCFACPRTTKEPENFTNIFNIIGKDDVVTKVPLSDWEYLRYGVDLFTKTQVADSSFIYSWKEIEEEYKDITDRDVYYNPELTFQFRIILDYLLLLMPTATEYKERLQPAILAVMAGKYSENVFEIILQAIQKLTPESDEEQEEIRELVDYLQVLLNQYVLQGNKDQIKNGYWDEEMGLGYNLFTEHNPYKYMATLNSSEDPSDIFSANTEYTRLTLWGKDLDLSLYDEDGLVGAINKNGVLEDIDGNVAAFKKRYSNGELYPVLVIDRSDEKMVISLPRDNEWIIKVSSEKAGTLAYSGILFSNYTSKASVGKLYYLRMKPGEEYCIAINSTGDVINEENSDYTEVSEVWAEKYSPSMIMRLETINVFHLTLPELIFIFAVLIAIVLIELLISIVLAIIRVIRKKKRKTIPTVALHIFNLAIFIVLEAGAWAIMPAIPIVQYVIKVIIGLIILGMGLKGYTKAKAKYKIYLCELSMLMIVLDILIEAFVLPRDSYDIWIINVIFYPLAILFACLMWKKPKVMQIEEDDIKNTKEGKKAIKEAKKLARLDEKELKEDLDEIGKEMQDRFDDDETT